MVPKYLVAHGYIVVKQAKHGLFMFNRHDRFIGRSEARHDWLTIVNLNRRVLTVPGPHNIVQQLIGRLSDERLWTGCSGCPAAPVCPSRSNAALFRHPVLGLRAAERVREVLDVVRDLKRDGMTMLIATHEMSFAREIADEVCYLHEGRILEQGPPDELLGRPSNERTRQFLQRVTEAGRM